MTAPPPPAPITITSRIGTPPCRARATAPERPAVSSVVAPEFVPDVRHTRITRDSPANRYRREAAGVWVEDAGLRVRQEGRQCRNGRAEHPEGALIAARKVLHDVVLAGVWECRECRGKTPR